MENQVILTSEAPAPIGPYSQAVAAGNLLFISGQIPLDPHTGAMSGSSIQEQTHRVMKNLHAILEASGYSFPHVVKSTIFLTDLQDFAAVNEIYGQYLEKGHYPARETIQVGALPREAKVEISMIAAR